MLSEELQEAAARNDPRRILRVGDVFSLGKPSAGSAKKVRKFEKRGVGTSSGATQGNPPRDAVSVVSMAPNIGGIEFSVRGVDGPVWDPLTDRLYVSWHSFYGGGHGVRRSHVHVWSKADVKKHLPDLKEPAGR